MENLVPDMTDAPDVTPELPVVQQEPVVITVAEAMQAVNDAIEGFGDSRKRIQKALVLCCAIAFDVERHKKNVQPFTILVKGIRGADQKALIGWIEKYAPAIWRADDAKQKRFVFNNSKELVFDKTAIEDNPWWMFARPAQEVSSTIDFREQLDNLVKRLV